jgi:hypothetical protein
MSVNKENLEKAIKAALEGPEERGLRIADYRFNIKPAEISRNGNTVSVVGGDDRYISRRRRGRPNDRIYYEFEKSGDDLSEFDIEINRGGFASVVDRYRLEDFHGRIRTANRIIKTIRDRRRELGDTDEMAEEMAQLAGYEESLQLLDGSWEGESAFLVANIALHAK